MSEKIDEAIAKECGSEVTKIRADWRIVSLPYDCKNTTPYASTQLKKAVNRCMLPSNYAHFVAKSNHRRITVIRYTCMLVEVVVVKYI